MNHLLANLMDEGHGEMCEGDRCVSFQSRSLIVILTDNQFAIETETETAPEENARVRKLFDEV